MTDNYICRSYCWIKLLFYFLPVIFFLNFIC